MSSIFLSHSHQDKNFARRLAFDLRKAGANVWIDEAELKIGDSLIEKISEGLENMEFVGAILSNSSVSSKWVKQELKVALTEELKLGKIKVLPILVEDCDIPTFLKDKLYADFRDFDRYDVELEKICDRLELNFLPYRKDGTALFAMLTRALEKNDEDLFAKSLNYIMRIPYPRNVTSVIDALGCIVQSIKEGKTSKLFYDLTAIEAMKAMSFNEDIGLGAVKILENMGIGFEVCPNPLIENITSSNQIDRLSCALGMQGFKGNQVPFQDAEQILLDESRAIHLRVASILIIGGLSHINADRILAEYSEKINSFPVVLQKAIIDAYKRYPWRITRFTEVINKMLDKIEISEVKKHAQIYLR